MTKSIQIKLLIAILAVLGVIAGLLVRGGRPVRRSHSARPRAAKEAGAEDNAERKTLHRSVKSLRK